MRLWKLPRRRQILRSGDWTKASLEALSEHIVRTHHAYVKRELPRLAVLAEKVVRRHGHAGRTAAIQAKLALLDEELSQHLAKEEVVLFPYVAKLERALATGSTLPRGCFGTVANPIAMMTAEHDTAGSSQLAEIRELSYHFTPPLGACPTYCGFYAGLQEFEQDLHQHIHLENNILFPRAIELESAVAVVSV